MNRIDLCKLNKISDKEEIPGEFSSVKGEYLIDSIGKTAFYKENGYMGGYAEYDADLRELLSAQILDLIDVPHANIILAQNGEDEGCLSINILNNNEEFVNIDLKIETSSNNEYTLEEFINQDSAKIANLPGITKEMIEERKEFVKNYLFVSALLSNPDVKLDHIIPIYNSETGKYRNPELYDMGIAFTHELEKSFPFKDADS